LKKPFTLFIGGEISFDKADEAFMLDGLSSQMISLSIFIAHAPNASAV
jgi:hypothetical protein